MFASSSNRIVIFCEEKHKTVSLMLKLWKGDCNINHSQALNKSMHFSLD